ncbi:uncharacterized protein LOC143222554 isoform X1 [Tachypleus tridentatus]|uniref:uncharacterized protein LOC143222554 isoform X1 n=1 Tax=Tachypleus tridentatus TaxID=6853 RepID=UPI003FD485A7
MKGPWIRINKKYDVMQVTDQVHLINYNSRNEEEIENEIKKCKPYQPPIPFKDCPSVPYSCLSCQNYLDNILDEVFCAFDVILKIDIKVLPSSGYQNFCGKFVIVKFYKGDEHDFASEIIYSVKKDCPCDQLKVGVYILLSMKYSWIKVGYKYGVMPLTDVGYLVNYNSRNEEKIEENLKYCVHYLSLVTHLPPIPHPPLPSVGCPADPHSCFNCHNDLDYKLKEIICTFGFILKIDIRILPGSEYKHSCGRFVIIKVYKGYKYDFASEINFSVKKDCYCNQQKAGFYILLSLKEPWNEVGYEYGAVQMTYQVHLVNYTSENEQIFENKLKSCDYYKPKPYLPYEPFLSSHSCPVSLGTVTQYLKNIICTFSFIIEVRFEFERNYHKVPVFASS